MLTLISCQSQHALLPDVVVVEVKADDYHWHIRHAGKDGKLYSADDIIEVGDIYLEAWKQGLKGITVYRDGSRSGVLVGIIIKPLFQCFKHFRHLIRMPSMLFVSL